MRLCVFWDMILLFGCNCCLVVLVMVMMKLVFWSCFNFCNFLVEILLIGMW